MSERVKEGVINTLAVLTVIFVIGLILLGIYAFSSHHDNSNSKQIDRNQDHSQSRKSSPSGVTNPSSRHYDPGDTDENEDNDNDNDVYYANCSEARANGAESIREGEPGYREELDRDGDGIACEPWHGR